MFVVVFFLTFKTFRLMKVPCVCVGEEGGGGYYDQYIIKYHVRFSSVDYMHF